MICCLFLGNCLTSCPIKTVSTLIINTVLSQCLNCLANCLTCSNINTCKLCDTGFYLHNSTCYASCPIATGVQLYPNMNNICAICECPTCINYSYNCTSCSGGLILDTTRGKCLTSCEDGQYNNSGNCQSCTTSCLICTSFSNCLICK